MLGFFTSNGEGSDPRYLIVRWFLQVHVRDRTPDTLFDLLFCFLQVNVVDRAPDI